MLANGCDLAPKYCGILEGALSIQPLVSGEGGGVIVKVIVNGPGGNDKEP